MGYGGGVGGGVEFEATGIVGERVGGAVSVGPDDFEGGDDLIGRHGEEGEGFGLAEVTRAGGEFDGLGGAVGVTGGDVGADGIGIARQAVEFDVEVAGGGACTGERCR